MKASDKLKMPVPTQVHDQERQRLTLSRYLEFSDWLRVVWMNVGCSPAGYPLSKVCVSLSVDMTLNASLFVKFGRVLNALSGSTKR